MSSRYLAVCLALVTAACTSATQEQACTLIGCSDGLVVRVEGAPEGMTTIELKRPFRSPVVLTCTGPDHCAGGIQFADQTPAHAIITITSGDRVKSVELDLAYTKSRPNGPGCEPECRQASVTVVLPQT
jgi:hypothetical protein